MSRTSRSEIVSLDSFMVDDGKISGPSPASQNPSAFRLDPRLIFYKTTEYVKTDSTLVWKVPESISWEEAAASGGIAPRKLRSSNLQQT